MFNEDYVKDVLKEKNPSIQYIILQNNLLHSINNDTSKKLADCVAQIVDLEEDNDSLQKTRTCMQGYVRNEADKYKETRRALDSMESYSLSSNVVYVFVFGIHIASYLFDVYNNTVFIINSVFCMIIMTNLCRTVCSINSYKKYEQKMFVNNDYLDTLLDNI